MRTPSLIIICSLLVLSGCRTKKVVEQQRMSLNSIEAIDFWDYDTIYPTMSVPTYGGDTTTMIIRHRHITNKKTNQHRDTLDSRKATQIALGSSLISDTQFNWKSVAIIGFLVFCVLGLFVVLVRARL